MNLINSLLTVLKKGNSIESVPEGFCPNCWGRQEYGGNFYQAVRNHGLDVNAKERFYEIAQRQTKVRKIFNEVTVDAKASLSAISNDTYLTSRVKLALFKIQIKDFDPSRVKVVTEAKNVYLMGLVSQAEADAAAEKARFVSGVERVVKVFEYL